MKECFNINLNYYLKPMMKLKDMIDGILVGSGSDFIVVSKGKKRYLIEMSNFNIKELKNSTTPYGSQI